MANCNFETCNKRGAVKLPPKIYYTIIYHLINITKMTFLNQIKYMALGALVILAVAYTSNSFDIENWAFIMMTLVAVCAEIQSKKK